MNTDQLRELLEHCMHSGLEVTVSLKNGKHVCGTLVSCEGTWLVLKNDGPIDSENLDIVRFEAVETIHVENLSSKVISDYTSGVLKSGGIPLGFDAFGG